jgi:hypothetical protein
MRNGKWPIPLSNNWMRLGYYVPTLSGKLYRYYVMARKLYRRIFYYYGEICEAWRTRLTKRENNIRVIYAVRMRIMRYSVTLTC